VKKSFILYHDQFDAIEDLTVEQKGNLLNAIFIYSRCGKISNLDPVVNMAFKFFRVTLDRDAEKWKQIAARNKENGKKGGRPKTNND